MSFRRELVTTLLCLSIGGYLFYDLRVVKGGIYTLLERHSQSLTKEHLASVHGHSITQADIEIELDAYLYRRGLQKDSLSRSRYDEIFHSCLDQLLTKSLISHYANQHKASHREVDPKEILQEVEFDKKQFSDSYELRDALRRMGYTSQDLWERASDDLVEYQYLRDSISDLPKASMKQGLHESVKVRHIFLSTWQKNPIQVKRTFQSHLDLLKSEQLTFGELSDRINEDLRAKDAKGHLGWMTNERLPKGLEQLCNLRLHTPTLLQSSLGWHYIELIARKQTPSELSFNQGSLSSLKPALEELLSTLRKRSCKQIQINPIK